MPVPNSILNKTLTSVTINGRYVAPRSFVKQTKLSSVIAPELRYVDNWSFYGCTSLTLDSTWILYLEYIGQGAFQDCTGLSGTLKLPYVVFIGRGSFLGCSNITTIELGMDMCVLEDNSAIPDSVTTIKVPSNYVDAYKTYPGWNSFASKIVSK